MNRKGFTLVELLAVIVILAVILIIAVPKITNVINNTKGSTLLSSAKLIAKSAESKYATNKMLGNTDTITCDSVAKINTDDYQKCSIIFDGDIAKVSIIGKGKFAGLEVCDATKDEASIDNGHSACKLNSAYQEVEYIESTGTQWIDTGWKHSLLGWISEFEFMRTSQNENDHCVSGYRANNTKMVNHYNNIYESFIDLQSNTPTYMKKVYLKYEVSKDNSTWTKKVTYKIFEDNIEYFHSVNNIATYVNSNVTLPLFGFKEDTIDATTKWFFIGRMYYYKLFENNVLVRNYIPVYRKSDGVIGLYDLVNDVFYTNAGTGTFLKGNNIVR